LRFIDGAGGLGLAAVTDEEQAAACAQSPMNFLALTLLRRLVERQRARRWAANNSRPGGSMPIEDFSLPLQACPRCRGALNITRAFGQVPDRPPRPGDYTVCFHCAAFLRVTGEGRRALVDQQELVRLAADDPDLVEQLLLVSTLVMRADQEARRQVLAEWAAAERAAKN
jgi:hypothetical protein